MRPFWKNENGKIKLSLQFYLRHFMNDVGFKYDEESKSILKTTDINKTVYDVLTHHEVYEYTLKFLESSNEEYFEEGGKFYVEGCEKFDVIEEWMNSGPNFINKVLKSVTVIDKFSSKNIFRDTYEECFLSFKNGVVRITKDNIELLDPSIVGKKYRFNSSLIHKENRQSNWDGKITITDKSANPKIQSNAGGEFEMFCKTVTSLPNNPSENYSEDNPPTYPKDYYFNEVGYNSLISGIGYLIHRKSDSGQGKLILLQDRDLDGQTRMGGTGKSLISQSLRCIQDVVEIHCESQSSKQFSHSDVKLGTRTIFYDELHKKNGLTLSDIYTKVTSQVVCERKYENPVTLRGDDVPKLLGGTNYMIFDPSSSSDTRRLHIVEFSDIGIYHKGMISRSWGSTKNMFGNNDDWTQNDWNEFYNFMFRCVQYYLKNKLVEDPNPQWKTSVLFGELYNNYGKFEVEWGIRYMKKDRLSKNHHIEENCPFSFELHNQLMSEIPNSRLTETRMKQMFYDLCESLGYEYNISKKHNGDSPNKRKLQRVYKGGGEDNGRQLHCIHISSSNDPS